MIQMDKICIEILLEGRPVQACVSTLDQHSYIPTPVWQELGAPKRDIKEFSTVFETTLNLKVGMQEAFYTRFQVFNDMQAVVLGLDVLRTMGAKMDIVRGVIELTKNPDPKRMATFGADRPLRPVLYGEEFPTLTPPHDRSTRDSGPRDFGSPRQDFQRYNNNWVPRSSFENRTTRRGQGHQTLPRDFGSPRQDIRRDNTKYTNNWAPRGSFENRTTRDFGSPRHNIQRFHRHTNNWSPRGSFEDRSIWGDQVSPVKAGPGAVSQGPNSKAQKLQSGSDDRRDVPEEPKGTVFSRLGTSTNAEIENMKDIIPVGLITPPETPEKSSPKETVFSRLGPPKNNSKSVPITQNQPKSAPITPKSPRPSVHKEISVMITPPRTSSPLERKEKSDIITSPKTPYPTINKRKGNEVIAPKTPSKRKKVSAAREVIFLGIVSPPETPSEAERGEREAQEKRDNNREEEPETFSLSQEPTFEFVDD